MSSSQEIFKKRNIKELATKIINECRKARQAGLQSAISRPVPIIENGKIKLTYLLYLSFIVRGEDGQMKQMQNEPFSAVSIDYETEKILSHKKLERKNPGKSSLKEYSLPDYFLSSDDPDKLWEELYSLYPAIIEAYASYKNGKQIDIDNSEIARFSQLFQLSIQSYFKNHYYSLNPDFFVWLETFFKLEN